MQACTLTPKKKRHRQFPVPLGIVHRCFCRRPNNPDVTSFELLYQSHEVGDSSHRNVLQRPCRSFRDRISQAYGPPFRNENPINTSTFRGSKYGTQIPRILDSIETDYERSLAASNLFVKSLE